MVYLLTLEIRTGSRIPFIRDITSESSAFPNFSATFPVVWLAKLVAGTAVWIQEKRHENLLNILELNFG